MNSFWTTFAKCLCDMKSDKYNWANNTIKFKCDDPGNLENRARHLISEMKNSFSKDVELDKAMNSFANNSGCLGNFTLTIAGNNTKIYGDYWDIKLYEQNYIEKVEHIKGDVINPRFVNFFFQWDYVDIKNDTYRFKPLYEGHSIENLYPSELDFINLLESMNEKIIRRGKFMYAMLQIATSEEIVNVENSDLGTEEKWPDWNVSAIYKKIVNNVFLKVDKYYKDYMDVFCEIKDCLTDSEYEAIKDIVNQATYSLKK